MATIRQIKVKDVVYDISPSPSGTLDTTTKDNAFASSDVAQASATAWTDVAALAATETNKSMFTKATQMMKNTRYLYNIIGTGFSTSSTIKKAIDGKAASNHSHDLSAMINGLSVGSATPEDADYYVCQYAGGGNTTSTYHRRPMTALWDYIKSKGNSTWQPKGSYAAASHTHTKSQITDFPTSLPASDVYAWAKANTKPSYSWNEITGKPSSFTAASHTHTKSQITDFPSSLKNPTSLTIQGNGTALATYDGSAAKTVNITKSSVGLGNADNTADASKSVKFARETYISQYKTVNLTDLNQNTWYPVTGTSIPYNGLRHLKCNVQLNSGSKPSWSTHNSGFTAVVDILEEASGWGTTNLKGIVLNNDQIFINDSNKPPVGYEQMGNSSIPVWWLRGGGIYFLAADYDCTWTIRKSKYENSNQSVEPKTTYSGVHVNRLTIVANLDGTASYANSAGSCTTASKIGTGTVGANNKPIYINGGTPTACSYSLGNACSKSIRTLTSVGSSGWRDAGTDQGFVPDMAFMAYWNGAYSGSSSNLAYCNRGAFGTIVTKNAGDYAAASHTHDMSTLTGNVLNTEPSTNNHKVVLGKSGLDKCEFYEYGGIWNFYRMGSGKAELVASIQPDGVHATLKGTADAANSAAKLDTATAGSTTQPVYFSGGKPVAIGYTIAKSVPADAKFTDTNTWRGIQNNLTSTAADQSLSAAQGKILKDALDKKTGVSVSGTTVVFA